MVRQRAPSGASTASSHSASAEADQELGSMYDYLAKIILLGPSGCGKSCLLHRFVRNEWRVLSSQTIGVEFSSKIIKVGTGARRKRVKLQLWDTAGQERFRSVTRSYYRGAAGALLVYDITSHPTFTSLPTFLADARALASPNLTVVLVGNKADLSKPPASGPVSAQEAARWASLSGISVSMETSALNGDNVDEVFARIARMIVTKIELGEVDPDDPSSGIQYGDSGGWVEASTARRPGTANGWKNGLREWESVFRGGAARRGGRCC
ncbi:P-loop containing nucleoside triphosphate hydrolase protein [Sphaerosporella brunnea]|uniref:P-loop containing nucleoside triphosphate hydrolase protein n=1 Tax=Sphaerosporella brunnea TaxID=1250544 RepID=A0A5J5F1M1_9PEZI|nr:P-loop containing nucleoside triphosphate hydrolase protein [Sphaerosporella brunnea]